MLLVRETSQRGVLREAVDVERLSRFLQHLNQLGPGHAVTDAQIGEALDF